MDIENDSYRPERKGLLSLLRIGRSDNSHDASLAAFAQHMRNIAPGSQAEILAGMAEFLEWHELEFCHTTLTVAFDYVIGSDPLLVTLINQRVAHGEPVTMDWLERLRGDVGDEVSSGDLNKTFARIEQQLADFGATTSAARKATREYNESLEGHAEQLGSAEALDASVNELLGVVRAMIARTDEMEKEMIRSEEQTRELRKDLEIALQTAEEDPLTGVANRRAFEKEYEREYYAAQEAVEPLIVAFCDIDHFKRVNDNHGHSTGDRVLKLVARELSRASSDRCFIARHGGEEFALLFRGRTIEQVSELLDLTREKLSQRRLIDRDTDKPIGYVTFSAGVADVFAHADRSAALKAADIALYRAKEQGRNRIVVAEG